MSTSSVGSGLGRVAARVMPRMSRGGRMSIGKKLYLSCGITSALFVAVGGIALLSMNSLASSHKRVSNHVLPSLLAAQSADVMATEMHSRQLGYVLDRLQHDNYTSAQILFASDLNALAKVTEPQQRDALTAIKAAYAESVRTDARLWQSVQAGRRAEVANIVSGPANIAATNLSSALGVYEKSVLALEQQANRSFDQTHSSSLWLIVGLCLTAALVAGLFAFLIARAVTRGTRELLVAADGIALGDVDQEVRLHSGDELGRTADAFRRMIAYLKRTAAAAGEIAAGDLTNEFEPVSERDALGNAFTAMIASLRKLVGELAGAATTVSSSSQQLVSTSGEAGKAVSEIANAVSDVAQGAERQVRMVEAAHTGGEETREAAIEAARLADEGRLAVEEADAALAAMYQTNLNVSEAVSGVVEASSEIGSIVSEVTAIASQTNLLALNAAIEAAHAGEQGRGFAVVADEVRKLAEQSRRAAASIQTLIGDVQKRIEGIAGLGQEAAKLSDEASTKQAVSKGAFLRISEAVENVREHVLEIVEATNEVAAVAEQSSASAEQVSASTEQTSASTMEIAGSAQELARTADELGRLVGNFRLAA